MRFETLDSVLRGEDWVFFVCHQPGGTCALLPMDHLDRTSERRVDVGREDVRLVEPGLLEFAEELAEGWFAWRQDQGSEWERAALPVGSVYLLRYHVELVGGTGNPDLADMAGAYINAWVVAACLDEATATAAQHLQAEGLWPAELEHSETVTESSVGESGLPYFRQVRVDGTVVVIHPYEEP